MAEFFDALNEDHIAFIGRQPVFFVATAAPDARINLSPKGYDVVRVLGATHIAYLDLGGSGNETQAHLAQDGRITLMFCAFDNPALILRVYGRGRFVMAGDDGYAALAAHFPRLPGARQVFVIDIDSVQTSCGWGVPHMTLERPRETLAKAHRQWPGEQKLAALAERTRSIDGLPVRAQTVIPAWDG